MRRHLLWFKQDLRLDDHPPCRPRWRPTGFFPCSSSTRSCCAGRPGHPPHGCAPRPLPAGKPYRPGRRAAPARLAPAGGAGRRCAGDPGTDGAPGPERGADPRRGGAPGARPGRGGAPGPGRYPPARAGRQQPVAPRGAADAGGAAAGGVQPVPRAGRAAPQRVPAAAGPESLPPLPEAVDALFEPLPTPTRLGLGEPVSLSISAFPFSGGETAALARVRDYLWTSQGVRGYQDSRNGMVGSEYSSKFSPGWPTAASRHGASPPSCVVTRRSTAPMPPPTSSGSSCCGATISAGPCCATAARCSRPAG